MATVYANCNDIAAHLPEVARAVKAAADVVGAKASGTLAAHRHSGVAEIKIEHGKLDYYVVLDDTRGQRAAAAIEYGHVAPDGRFIPGIHALTGAM